MDLILSYKVIGRHLRDARERLNLSQQEVADSIEISLAYYGKIERGDIRPNLERLAQACEALKVPLAEVFRGAFFTNSELTNTDPTANEFIKFFEDIASYTDEPRRELIMKISMEIANYKKI